MFLGALRSALRAHSLMCFASTCVNVTVKQLEQLGLHKIVIMIGNDQQLRHPKHPDQE